MTKFDYTIIASEESFEEFLEGVEDLLRSGWETTGGVFIREVNNRPVFYQAMERATNDHSPTPR